MSGIRFPPDLEPDAQPTITLLDQHFEAMRQVGKGSPTAAKSSQLRDHGDEHASVHKSNPWMNAFTPTLTRAYELSLRAETHRRGTMLVLAVHAHHAKHGEWPNSLKVIDKKLGLEGLRGLRRDPFSGKPFKYEIKDGQPLLYTVGSDGKDDSGRHDPKWGEGKKGGDFVFWPPQPK